MTRPYSLTNPHPEHRPTVGRVNIGMTPISPQRPVYGTTLRCSCGEKLGRGNIGNSKVANVAPTRGGRLVAANVYRSHLESLAQADIAARAEAFGVTDDSSTEERLRFAIWDSEPTDG